MTAPIPACKWDHDGLLHRELLLGATHDGDDVVEIGVRGRADGLVVYLNARQVAELRDALDARLPVMLAVTR